MPSDHLIFARNGVQYAVAATAVQEIAWRPELCTVADASPWVIGAFNDHGRVVPVLDLPLCFGRTRPAARLSDAIIVLGVEGDRFAIIADELLDTEPIEPQNVEALNEHRDLLGSAAPLVSGIARRSEQLSMVLDARELLAGAAAAMPMADEVEAAWAEAASLDSDRQIFLTRARTLAQLPEGTGHADREHFAVVSLEAEVIGLPVRAVQEFMHIGTIWPVPCCPLHILGSTNVRGDILTLVDLRPVLGLPVQRPPSEVVVIRNGDLTVGLGVAEILDIVNVDGVTPLPLPAETGQMPFCRGAARSGEQIFTVIDIEAMLASRLLHVADERGRGQPRPEDRLQPRGE